MNARIRHSAAFLLLGAGCAFAGFSDSRVGGPEVGGQPAIPAGVGPIDEHLGQPVDLTLTFTDETGQIVALKDLFHKDRPVLLDLVYYTCPNLCDLILNGQTQAMRQMSWTPGKEYEIVTISIDPSEHQDVAAAKKATYVNAFGRPAPGWHFRTDHDGNVKRLAEQMGYHYRYDARQEQYIHPAAIMMLTPEGHISRYLYGAHFNSRDMRFALDEAAEGRTSLSIDRILLWCFHYDPASNKYVLYAGNAMKTGGVLTVFLIAFFLIRLFRADRARYGAGHRGHREKMA